MNFKNKNYRLENKLKVNVFISNAVNTKEGSRRPRGTLGPPAPAPWQPSAASSNRGAPAGGPPPSRRATRGRRAEPQAVSSRGRARTRGRPRRLTASSSRTGAGPSRRRGQLGTGGTTGPPSSSRWLPVATGATGTRLARGTGNGQLKLVYIKILKNIFNLVVKLILLNSFFYLDHS